MPMSDNKGIPRVFSWWATKTTDKYLKSKQHAQERLALWFVDKAETTTIIWVIIWCSSDRWIWLTHINSSQCLRHQRYLAACKITKLAAGWEKMTTNCDNFSWRWNSKRKSIHTTIIIKPCLSRSLKYTPLWVMEWIYSEMLPDSRKWRRMINTWIITTWNHSIFDCPSNMPFKFVFQHQENKTILCREVVSEKFHCSPPTCVIRPA